MCKKDNDIIITFLGESREDVTGSSVLINYKKKNGERRNILIEMGLVQGGNTIEQDLANNRRMLTRFTKEIISSIDTVFLCHSHCDHTASIPYLNTGSFKGNIICSKESYLITKDLVADSVKIHLSNVNKLKLQKGKNTNCFYTEQDMYSIFERIEYRKKDEKYRLNEEIEYRFINSGHVLGGCILELWIRKPNNSTKHIVYTSDMGSDYNNKYQYFVPKRASIPKCNLLISEATYNNPHRSWTKEEAVKERKDLKREIKEALCSGKEILMSSFSFGRLQNLVCMLYDFYNEEEWFNEIPVIIDGVLLHKINDDYLKVLDGEDYNYFNKVMKWENLKKNKGYDGTLAVMADRKPKIIISTSGFLTNGRISSYLEHMVNSTNSVIYLTGYCGGENSLGYKLLSPTQGIVKINKITLTKKAIIKQLKTFSSHIQYKELIDMFKMALCDKILIHHSSKEDKGKFINEVREELKKVGKLTKIEEINNNNFQITL